MEPRTNSGDAFNYFTFGVGCSMVEVDCLTGNHHVIRFIYPIPQLANFLPALIIKKK